jgi:predicted nucleotidyltransferase
VKLAEYFKVKENDLLVAWLSYNLVYELEDEDVALEALQLAEEKVTYITRPKDCNTSLINLIKTTLKKDGRVTAAWLFGSAARGEEKLNSDVEIMVEMNKAKKYSMFDLLDIAFIIENKINRKVDLVEKGYLKDFAMKTASNDLIKFMDKPTPKERAEHTLEAIKLTYFSVRHDENLALLRFYSKSI